MSSNTQLDGNSEVSEIGTLEQSTSLAFLDCSRTLSHRRDT